MIVAAAFLLISGLTGSWLFEAVTDDGTLRANLILEQSGSTLTATMEVDRHVLKGESQTDGAEFRLALVHADGSGAAHDGKLTLTGRLSGERLTGNWDDGTSSGTWTAKRP